MPIKEHDQVSGRTATTWIKLEILRWRAALSAAASLGTVLAAAAPLAFGVGGGDGGGEGFGVAGPFISQASAG